jgi:curved DNA-binding protein CbpA
MFRMIQSAYDTLVDPVRRAEYDRIHLGVQSSKPEPMHQPKRDPKTQQKPDPKPGPGTKSGNTGSRSSPPRNSGPESWQDLGKHV